MSVIYKPKGKAGEYADLACNLYTGCTHGCLYCYAPKMLRRKPEEFHTEVKPRKDILKKLEKEAPSHKGKEVFLCFTCDPYPCGQSIETTRKAIKILHSNGVAVNILTKGGRRAMGDFDLLEKNPTLSKFGATLTFDNDVDSKKWEPWGDDPFYRMATLEKAHERGIPTWVSLEPVIKPEQTLSLIRQTVGFVDHYKVGRWNYDKRSNDIDWADFLRRVTALLDSRDASYYIKKDLAVFSDKGLE
jgi:DNA repair photolyase